MEALMEALEGILEPILANEFLKAILDLLKPLWLLIRDFIDLFFV